MPYVIFNSGKSSRWVDPSEGYQLQAGEAFSDEPAPPPPPSPPDVRDQIEAESRLALRSGALYELIDLAMRQFLEWAQSQNPSITEADLLDANGPYFSVGYARNKESRDRLLALLAQK